MFNKSIGNIVGLLDGVLKMVRPKNKRQVAKSEKASNKKVQNDVGNAEHSWEEFTLMQEQQKSWLQKNWKPIFMLILVLLISLFSLGITDRMPPIIGILLRAGFTGVGF